MSQDHSNIQYTTIIYPEFLTLKAEVEKLCMEISMLLFECDDLQLVTCKNIEMVYILAVGSFEYKVFKLNCQVLRLKRKISMIQAKKNCQEKVILSEIEQMLDEEFAEFQLELEERINKMNQAICHSKGRMLSAEETKEMKKLYRTIVIKNEHSVKIGYVPMEDNVVFSRLMDAGKLLFGKITQKEMKGKWLKIKMGIYLRN